jgi:very-short-patch-repair endonuclease
VPPTRRRLPTGLVAIRDSVPDHDCAVIDELLVTTRARTVVDCLLLLPEAAGRTFLDRALQQRWLTLDELVLRTQCHISRRGAPLLRKHVRVAAFGVRSEAERALRRLLRSAGITGWRPDYPLAGVGVLDFAFPSVRLAIEVRAWHSAPDRFQRDRTRQNLAVTAGWTVLRFTWEDLTSRPDEVVATVRGTLARLQKAS